MSDPTALAAEARRAETPAAAAALLAALELAGRDERHSTGQLYLDAAAALRRLTEEVAVAEFRMNEAEIERDKLNLTITEMAHAYREQSARTTAAVEAMRERAAELIERYAVNVGGNGEVKPLVEDRNGMKDAVRQAYAITIRALPVDGGDALAERLRAEAERALRWEWMTNDGLRRAYPTFDEYWQLCLAALYPAPAGKETT